MPDKPFETLFTGRHHIRLEEVESTNTFALELVRTGQAAEGTVISAKSQTAGRGQRGNTWNSAPGENLTVSIVLRPGFLAPALQFDLTRVVALALAEQVQTCCPQTDVKVKWPNDIYIGSRKVAGILIENILGSTRFIAAVVGIGLNVNQHSFGELSSKATSLKLASGNDFDHEILLQQLCSVLEKYYLMLRAGKQEELRQLYHEKLFLRGEMAVFSSNGERFRGTITGTTPEGLLMLTTEAGEERQFVFKEVVFEG
ncbi:MAG: biotin--[acetyl-CoA-carboxylase] ligase [Bacteroidota bacterium]|jgi:BirA family biotin operon repressor/biotin-[acetyl-CoA-carboxylase] ligase